MLQWDFNKKVGECVIWNYDHELKLNLYEGNAFLIFIHEFKADGKEKYSLWTFFADEKHMKTCLGLNSGNTYNIVEDIRSIRINKVKCRNYKKIVSLLVQAFDNITIEIYSE